MDPVNVASAERERGRGREREEAREIKRTINIPTCHDQPNINFCRLSHSFKEIASFFSRLQMGHLCGLNFL
jgi:hypothetical protein